MQSDKISYGPMMIHYHFLVMKRKSFQIIVYPDKRVLVKAPLFFTKEKVQERVQKKARWIKEKLNYFEEFHPLPLARNYVSGESHLYLGRKYRLKIRQLNKEQILLFY